MIWRRMHWFTASWRQRLRSFNSSSFFFADIYYGFTTYLKKAVINGWSYDILKANYPDLKLNRREYYAMRRKFFWILDQYVRGFVHEME